MFRKQVRTLAPENLTMEQLKQNKLPKGFQKVQSEAFFPHVRPCWKMFYYNNRPETVKLATPKGDKKRIYLKTVLIA